ncbi:MAG: preprotein translocase subunit SecE [bacterium]|nr:preprotein translocase subunit SecE [bacterium]
MDIIDRVVNYFRSSKSELQKVSWPTKQETVRYSLLIIGISIVVAVFFLLLDTGLQDGVTAMLKLRTTNAPTVTTGEPVTPSVQTSPVGIEAVDESGQPAAVQVTPEPINGQTQQ